MAAIRQVMRLNRQAQGIHATADVHTNRCRNNRADSGNYRTHRRPFAAMNVRHHGNVAMDKWHLRHIQQLLVRFGLSRTEPEAAKISGLLTPEQLAELDLFDRMQLQSVLTVCKQCKSLSEAGRKLFAVSRSQRGSTNDSDRLRKYLAKFGLEWANL
jgi:transcriptional regulatory protein RtcR